MLNAKAASRSHGVSFSCICIIVPLPLKYIRKCVISLRLKLDRELPQNDVKNCDRTSICDQTLCVLVFIVKNLRRNTQEGDR
jgi:hypothetical protein